MRKNFNLSIFNLKLICRYCIYNHKLYKLLFEKLIFTCDSNLNLMSSLKRSLSSVFCINCFEHFHFKLNLELICCYCIYNHKFCELFFIKFIFICPQNLEFALSSKRLLSSILVFYLKFLFKAIIFISFDIF